MYRVQVQWGAGSLGQAHRHGGKESHTQLQRVHRLRHQTNQNEVPAQGQVQLQVGPGWKLENWISDPRVNIDLVS